MTHVADDLATHYNTYYDGSESEWRRIGSIEKCNRITSLGALVPHDSILDVGAGDGANLLRLSELSFGAEYHAVELSGTAIDILRRRGVPQLASAQTFDGAHLPYEDQSIDLVYMSHVVEHLEHPRVLLSEARRVGKSLIVEVPLEHNLRLPATYVPDAVGHINHYTPQTLRYLLQTSHFEIIAEELAAPGLASLQHMHGKLKGKAVHAVKGSLLRLGERVATSAFTYNFAVLAQATERFRISSPKASG